MLIQHILHATFGTTSAEVTGNFDNSKYIITAGIVVVSSVDVVTVVIVGSSTTVTVGCMIAASIIGNTGRLFDQ